MNGTYLRFKNGSESLEDNPREWHPSTTIINVENVEVDRWILMALPAVNRRLSIKMLKEKKKKTESEGLDTNYINLESGFFFITMHPHSFLTNRRSLLGSCQKSVVVINHPSYSLVVVPADFFLFFQNWRPCSNVNDLMMWRLSRF